MDCVEDILIYADQLRYSAVENSPDHALAMLDFAESNTIRNVWIDAFAHCVGMNNELAQSTEFEVSRSDLCSTIPLTHAFLANIKTNEGLDYQSVPRNGFAYRSRYTVTQHISGRRNVRRQPWPGIRCARAP